MKNLFLFAIGIFSVACAFAAEGDVGTQAYQWPAYKALDSVTYPNGLAFSPLLQNKVVLLVVFADNCGGCNANAPTIGKLADSLGSGGTGVPFQAVGCEINNGKFSEMQASYYISLTKNAPKVNFPLLHVPFDTAITSDGIGTNWHRYNSYRDVYFIIDHTGKIVARINGNRSGAMTIGESDSIKTALTTAIANTPTGLLCIRGCDSPYGLTAHQQAGGFSFSFGTTSLNGPVSLQIFDFQGRTIRQLVIPQSGGQAEWNGLDAHGSPVPYGPYFLHASGTGLSVSRRLNWLP